MNNIVNIDLTNNSCWGAANIAGSDNEINLCIKLLPELLDKTDIKLEFTKPDGVIITTDSLEVDKEQISYELLFSLYVTKGTLKLRVLATGYTSEYINFNINDNYTETDDICVKFNSSTKEFNINKCATEKSIVDIVYPVGSIYMSVNNVNPATLFGGSWVAWGAGKVPVGIDTSQTEFNTVEKTGGAKTHTLTNDQMPSHTHTFTGKSHSHGLNGHTHSFSATTGGGGYHRFGLNALGHTNTVNLLKGLSGCDRSSSGENAYYDAGNRTSKSGMLDTLTVSNHTHSVSGTTGGNSGNTTSVTQGGTNSNTGGGKAHNNLQPYITCYMWKRTA